MRGSVPDSEHLYGGSVAGTDSASKPGQSINTANTQNHVMTVNINETSLDRGSLGTMALAS